MNQAVSEITKAETTLSTTVPWGPWADLGGTAIQHVTGASNADGRQVVLALTSAGTICHNWQTTPNAPDTGWSGWYDFGNPDDATVVQIAVGVNSDGRLAIVAADQYGIVWYNAQVAPSQGWGAWTHVPGVIEVTSVAIGRQRNGFLQLFAIAGGVLSVSTQTPTGWTRWTALPGPALDSGVTLTAMAVAENQDGRTEVAGLFSDNSVANIFQTSANGGWSSWLWHTPFASTDLLNGIALAPQEAGWLTTVVTGSSGDLYYRYQQAAGEATATSIVWSSFARIANPNGIAIGPVTLAHNGDGRLQAFAVGSDHAVWHLIQTAINVPVWHPWVSFGAEADKWMNGRPAVGRNADGRLEAFAPASDGTVGRLSETAATTRLPWFETLVAGVAPLVHLHPDELYMPASFEAYLTQTRYVDSSGTNHGPLSPANLTWPAFGGGGYLTYPWLSPQISAGDLGNAACYAHVRSSTDWSLGGGYDIQYWFFYGFNGPGFLGVAVDPPFMDAVSVTLDTAPAGDHEGDWEHVVVRVGPGGGVERLYCSQHGSGTWYNRASSPGETNGYTLTPDGHPLVYAAQYGHPSYPYPGEFPTPGAAWEGEKWDTRFKAGLINHAAPGQQWNCYEPGRHQLVAIDVPGCETFTPPWWLPFQGRCGMLHPSVGNTIVEAANHLATLLAKAGLSGLGGYLLKKIALAIVTGIANVYPLFDDYAGPTAPMEKGSWYTGL